MRLRLLALAACLFAITAAARADVLYTLTITGPPGTLANEFGGVTTWDEPSILTTDTNIPGSSLTTVPINGSIGIPFDGLTIDPTSYSGCTDLGSSDPFGCVQGTFVDGVGFAEGFTALLTSPGTYDGTDNGGGFVYTLSITSTPEPSSICLLGTSVLGLIGLARRRFS